jgi:type IV pilus assembly protein PilC
MQSQYDIEHLIRSQKAEGESEARLSSQEASTPRFRVRRVRDREKVDFCTQLSVLLLARISLHQALVVLKAQAKSDATKDVIDRLLASIQRGNSFGRAMAEQAEVFDNLFVVSAEIGEETGRLPEVLAHLAQYLEKVHALKRKVYQALAYPALVIAVACFAVTFLLVFIIPSFAEMFRNFQIELPWSTEIVIKISAFAVAYGYWVLPVLVVLVFLVYGSLRSSAFRHRAGSLAMRAPIVGDILLKNQVARFCRTLGTLLQSQVSLVDALMVTQRINTAKTIREEIGRLIKYVKQGRTMAEPLVESAIFPPMVAQMIAVGEETSELDSMLLKVADYYEKELDEKVETLSTVIEPMIIILLGILVAVILISMYLPMFDLINVVGGG